MSKRHSPTTREAMGAFHEAASLKAALQDLRAAGFGSGELGLLASEYAVKEALADIYECCIDETPGSTWAASEAFVMKDSSGDTGTALGGPLYFIGGASLAGGVVASAAVLGGALLAAVSGAVGAIAVGAAVAGIIHQKDADFLHEQLDEGRLLLFVRVQDEEREARAKEILGRHSDARVRVLEVPAGKAA